MKATPNKPNKDTRTALLDVAQRMVQRESFDGFSFRDIAEEVGIRKASIHYHFETKDALAVAMLDRAREGLGDWAVRNARRSPRDRLHAYCFELYRDALGAGDQMCPAGAFAGSWSHQSDVVRNATLGVVEQQRQFLRDAFRDGLSDASLVAPPGLDASGAADWFATFVQGALVTSRMLEGRPLFEKMCLATLALVCQP